MLATYRPTPMVCIMALFVLILLWCDTSLLASDDTPSSPPARLGDFQSFVTLCRTRSIPDSALREFADLCLARHQAGVRDWDEHWTGPLEHGIARGVLSQAQIARYVRQGMRFDCRMRNRYVSGDVFFIEYVSLARKNLPDDSVLVITPDVLEISVDDQTERWPVPLGIAMKGGDRSLVWDARQVHQKAPQASGHYEVQLTLHMSVGVRSIVPAPRARMSMSTHVDIEVLSPNSEPVELRDDPAIATDVAKHFTIDAVSVLNVGAHSKVLLAYTVSEVCVPIVGLVTLRCAGESIEVGYLCVPARWGDSPARGWIAATISRLPLTWSHVDVGICPALDYAKRESVENAIVGSCLWSYGQALERSIEGRCRARLGAEAFDALPEDGRQALVEEEQRRLIEQP